MIKCEQCGEEFEHPHQRGRPPKKCPTCRNSPPPQVEHVRPLSSTEVVDRLEAMLKSRGIHISQQEDK